jgi:Domain of unknown function DUF29
MEAVIACYRAIRVGSRKKEEDMSRREDHYAWALGMARALRAGDVALVDLPDVVEELEQVGRSDAYELESRIMQIMEHC